MPSPTNIQINFDTTTAIARDLPVELRDEISDNLSFEIEGARYAPSFKKGHWDGRMRIATKGNGTLSFPTGMLSDVVSIIKLYIHTNTIYTYNIIDNRETPVKSLSPSWIYPYDLRYYQTEAVELAKQAGRGVWHIGTGGGKMVIAARMFYETGLPGMLLVNSIEAVNDTYKEFKQAMGNVHIGQWHGGKKELGDITIATVQSLFTKTIEYVDENTGKAASRKQKPNPELWGSFIRARILILDEMHHGGSKQWYDIAKKSNAYYKIGQTGTPFREDGKGMLLQASTGRIIYVKTTKQLQDEGFLSKSHILFHITEAPSGYSKSDYVKLTPAKKYHYAIVTNNRRNLLIKNIIEAHPDRNILCLVKLKEHGEILSEITGLPFVHGTSKDRDRIRAGLDDGTIKGVIATSLYDESVNIPRLDMAVNAAGQSPTNAQAQRHGRILRKFGETEAIFIDLYDGWARDVKKHSDARVAIMENDGHEINLSRFNVKGDGLLDII